MKSNRTFHPIDEPAATLMQPCEPEMVRWDTQQIQLAVAAEPTNFLKRATASSATIGRTGFR
jgi:hypothetical protein